jgi:phosphoenolpyruvate carboxykinase (ATP)
MPLSLTRSLVDRILSGTMNAVTWQREPVFGLLHPIQVDGIEDRYLDPRSAWIDNNAYDVAARQLADQFAEKLNKHSSVLDSLA